MQVAKTLVRVAQVANAPVEISVSEKEFVLISEIGLDQIPTATSFVEFIASNYGASPSGIWYTLKILKKKGLIDFMEKGEGYKPLSLTNKGVAYFRRISLAKRKEVQPIHINARIGIAGPAL
jgi:hypothetical protein